MNWQLIFVVNLNESKIGLPCSDEKLFLQRNWDDYKADSIKEYTKCSTLLLRKWITNIAYIPVVSTSNEIISERVRDKVVRISSGPVISVLFSYVKQEQSVNVRKSWDSEMFSNVYRNFTKIKICLLKLFFPGNH